MLSFQTQGSGAQSIIYSLCWCDT